MDGRHRRVCRVCGLYRGADGETTQVLFESSPSCRGLISNVGGDDIDINASLLVFSSSSWPVLLMAFAVTQASRWAADEEDGLQELVLATPQPRLRGAAGAFRVLTTATVIHLRDYAGVDGAGRRRSAALRLDWGQSGGRIAFSHPAGAANRGVGYLLAGWLRTAIDTGLLSFLLVIWFVISFIGPELKIPDAVLRLSAFYYYGTPLVNGLPAWGHVDRAGGRRSGAGIGVCAIHAQRHRPLACR